MTYSGAPQDLPGLIAEHAERLRRLEALLPIVGPMGPAGQPGDRGPAGLVGAAPVVGLGGVTLDAPGASLTLSPISGQYRNLIADWEGRGDTVANAAQLLVQFNGDAAGPYDSEFNFFQGASGSGGFGSIEVVGGTSMNIGTIIAATGVVLTAGAGRIWIPNYAGMFFHKMAICHSGHKIANSTGNITNALGTGFWRFTDPVTSITLRASAGNLDMGFSCYLYAEP
jgi:hypothetical protein